MNAENSSPAAESGAPQKPAPSSRGFSPWLLVALLALGLAGWQWLETRQRLVDVQQEAGRRLAEADAMVKEMRGAQKQLVEQVETLQGRLGAIDGRLDDFQGQGAALQNLYQEMARGREEVALLEVEQSVVLAAQQLQLAGNVPVALLALQSADAQLARLDQPAHLALRKALAGDIERLKALPFADIAGISLRLEQAAMAIETLPLAVQGHPVETPVEPAALAADQAWWAVTLGEAWRELRSLVRIQRFDRAEPPLLAPGQDYFLRENLKLRLLNARLALFAHEQTTFRNELKTAAGWLERYFDGDDKAVQATMAGLRELAAMQIVIDLPSLTNSQKAMAALRHGKGRP